MRLIGLGRGPTPEAALDAALGGGALRGRIAVAVPDPTRPLDPGPALEALAARAEGSMLPVVGLGLHRRRTPAEVEALTRWGAIDHDPDDAVPTAIVDGIPGSVFRPVAEADLVVGVGVIELHQYAGVSGGHKAVAVGCGGRATIAALHHRDRVLAPGVEVGRLDGNPFRAAIDGLGAAAGCRLALCAVPQAGLWLAGDPVEVVAAGAAALNPWTSVPSPVGGAVLRVPASKGQSLYQASRAATYLALSPRPPLLPSALLVVEAPMPEGLGAEAGFVAALRGARPPWTSLLRGPPPEGAGAQRAVMLALLAQRYRLAVAGVLDPAPFVAVGIDATRAPAPRVPGWLDIGAPFHELPQLMPLPANGSPRAAPRG
jgi:hypothetical protein